MPKRSNPFGDCSPLQFKTHIGPKEVDTGVCHEKNMKIVYEKTKDLLFQGARKNTHKIMVDANSNHIMEDMKESNISIEEMKGPSTSLLSGQLCFDRHGQLMAPYSTDQSETIEPAIPTTTSKNDVCRTCGKLLNLQQQSRCHFCDKISCSSCNRNCDTCMENFCQICSVLNYEEAMERAFCFNCST